MCFGSEVCCQSGDSPQGTNTTASLVESESELKEDLEEMRDLLREVRGEERDVLRRVSSSMQSVLSKISALRSIGNDYDELTPFEADYFGGRG